MAKRLLIGTVAGLAAGVPWAYGASRFAVYLAGAGGMRTNTLLVDAASWMIPAAALLGLWLARTEGVPVATDVSAGVVVRRDDGTPFEHWSAAIAIVVLGATGVVLGGRVTPRLVETPHVTGFVMNLHFLGAVALVAAVCYHLAHRARAGDLPAMWPGRGDTAAFAGRVRARLDGDDAVERHTMAGQRLAYCAASILLGVLVLSGAVKVLAHLASLPAALKTTATALHDWSTVLALALLAIHLLVPPTSVVPNGAAADA